MESSQYGITTQSTPDIRSIGVLLIPGFDVIDFGGPLEYFNAIPGVQVHLISEGTDLSPVWSWTLKYPTDDPRGEWFIPTCTVDDAPPLDLLIVLGGMGVMLIEQGHLKRSVAFIKERYPTLKNIFSICTGNALTAASGILDGRRATGNKSVWPFVTSQGPKVDWVAEARWVVDGNSWSSSGVEAGTDMAYAFVKQFWGEDMADRIANTMEHAPNKDPANDPFAALYGLPGPWHDGPDTGDVPPGVPTRYAMLLYPGMASVEAFAAFESIHISAVPFQVTTIAATLDPITTNNQNYKPVHPGGQLPLRGQTMVPQHTFADADAWNIEVLIVPGTTGIPKDPQVVDFIKRQYPKLRHLITIGTGAVFAAEAGIATGKQITTSKYWFATVQEACPAVDWVWEARWTVADGGRLWASSGGIASFDAMYGFVSANLTPGAALYMSRGAEYVPHTDPSWDPFANIWMVA